MKSKVSALLDGEQTGEELAAVCAALSAREVRQDWANYAVIGAALRSEDQLDFDVSAKVMAALADEPTVLAPRSRDGPRNLLGPRDSVARTRWLSAFAAGIAGVSLVAWLALTASIPDPGVQLASAPASVPAVAVPADSTHNKVPQEMRDYVVAHQAHASGGAFTGGSRNVRAVSASRDGQ